MILTNNSAAVTDLESDNHYLPAIQVQFNSNAVATFVTGHTNVMATWAQGTAQPAQADVMASFSSRGPTGDWIKPDVTAPGVQVLAGTTPQPDQTTADNGPTGNLYMAIAGTSMSSPHSAGVSILVKAAHPTLDPGGDQVGPHDVVRPGRRQGGRDHPRRPVRHGRRLDPRRPRGRPDPRVRRELRRLQRGRG